MHTFLIMAALFLFLFFVTVFIKLTSSIHSNQVPEPGQYPYIVRIAIEDLIKNKNLQECTGTIIAGNMILTAAHCFNPVEDKQCAEVHIVRGDPDHTRLTPKENIAKCLEDGFYVHEDESSIPGNIRFWATKKRTRVYFCYRVNFLEGVIIHPDYNKKLSFMNDIALIRLKEPVNDQRVIFPKFQIGLDPPDECVVVGFGTLTNDKLYIPHIMRYNIGRKFETCMTHDIIIKKDYLEFK